MAFDLTSLFKPQSVALIGASRNSESPGHAIFRNLFRSGFQGVVYPVNPKAKHIEGVRAYASVSRIDDEIDLAVIVVPRDLVSQELEACGEKGVKAAIVITAGFKEIGEEGTHYQNEIATIAQQYGMALVGPNCLGLINGDSGIRLNATFGRTMPQAGNVAFLSQSGAVGIHALEFAQQKDVGFSKFISMGNKAVLHETDYLEALQNDPQTGVILCYLEHLKNPRAFLDAAQKITSPPNPKPILAVKSGRTQSGKRAASSHTGALAESDRIYDFLFEQCGIIRVDSLESLFDKALCFSHQPLPKGNDLMVVTNAGGPGIIAADTAEKHGLTLPETPGSLKTALKEVLPPTAGLNNPIDIIGDAGAKRYAEALKTIIANGEASSLLVMGTPQMMTHLREIAQEVCEVAPKAREKGISLLTSFVSANDNTELNHILDEETIPNYTYAENAVESLAATNRYREWLEAPSPGIQKFEVNQGEADTLLRSIKNENRHFLTEPESYRLFREYGFPVANYGVATKEEELAELAQTLHFPVVAKVVSPDVVHKIDVGGVKLNLENSDQLKEAFQTIQETVGMKVPNAKINGVLVQEMVKSGTEVIMGVKKDHHFGHLLMFGLGGSFVEVFEDVTFRIAPINPYDARQMVEQINSFPMLKGIRGKPGADLESLAEALQRLSQLVTDFPQITEIDLNPVFAMEEGIRVADARVFV